MQWQVARRDPPRHLFQVEAEIEATTEGDQVPST